MEDSNSQQCMNECGEALQKSKTDVGTDDVFEQFSNMIHQLGW